jgi:hypothetical protein
LARVALVSIVLIAALGALGVGVAAWQEGLMIEGVASTGEINPVFCDVSASPRGEVFIDNGGKAISFLVEEASPEEVFDLEYTVENRGSIPLEYYTEVNGCDSGLVVDNTPAQGRLGVNGDSAVGKLTIQVDPGVRESTIYNFNLELIFWQWSGVPR